MLAINDRGVPRCLVGGVDCVGEQDHSRIGVGVYYKGGT